MEIVLQFISIFIDALINTYFISSMAEQFQNIKYGKFNKLIFFLSILVTAPIIKYLKDNYMILSISLFCVVIMINLMLNLKIKFVKSIAIAFTAFLLFSLIESIIAFLFFSITKLTTEEIIQSPILSLTVNLCQFLATYLVILLIKYIKKHIANIDYIIKNVTSKTLLILLGLLMICVLPQLLLFAISKYSYSPTFILINSIQMILICIIIFFALKRTVEKDKAESELVTTKLHNETMSGMVDGLKTLKHDFNNIMQSLSSYSKAKEYKELDEYIDKLLKEFKIVNTLGLIDPEIFNEKGIYGIVGAKYFLITNDNITMDLEVFTNIKEINFPKPELSRILGILLDNAYEATKKCNHPYVRLEMKFDNRKCADIIRVINTYDTNTKIDLDKIYKRGFSTKKVKSGIGLWEVKKLVSKETNSQVYASIDGDKFIQNIIIEKDI